MLTQFFEEWNNALKNESVAKTQTNDQGVVVWQNGTFTFRDTQIQIHRKQNGQGGYHVELFVPKTNKFISNKKFSSKAKCAEAILMALLPGVDKEEVRAARAERRADAMRKKITEERIEVLRKANLKKEDFAWFCDHMNHNLQVGNSFYDDALVDIIGKFHDQLLCEQSYLQTLPIIDRSRHMERLYELSILVCKRAIHTKSGDKILFPKDAARLFRAEVAASTLPAGIIAVKKTFREIDDYLRGHTKKLIYLCQTLIEYYQNRTDRTPEQVLAAAEERKARARERKLRRLEGLQNEGSYTVLGEVAPSTDKSSKKPARAPQQQQRQQKPPKKQQNKKQGRNQSTMLEINNDRPGMVSLANAFGSQLDGLQLSDDQPTE